MSTSTALTIMNGQLANLQGYLTQLFSSVGGIIIAVLVLFAGIGALIGLWHRKI